MTVPDAKKHPRLRRFVLRSVRLPVGRLTLRLVVPDANAWVRGGTWVPASQCGQEPPYWVRIWPAAVSMARVLARFGAMRGMRVLDLGCGLGLPGIAAALAGAHVTFVDRIEDALAFAVWNAERVRAPDAAVAGLQCDWARETVPGQFDVLLLSDVTYHLDHHGPIRRQVERCLAPQGVVLHADPGRDESRTFLSRMRGTFAVESLLHYSAAAGDPTGLVAGAPRIHVAAAARTPHSLAAWRAVFDALRSRDAARGRAEWHPTSRGDGTTYEVIAAAAHHIDAAVRDIAVDRTADATPADSATRPEDSARPEPLLRTTDAARPEPVLRTTDSARPEPVLRTTDATHTEHATRAGDPTRADANATRATSVWPSANGLGRRPPSPVHAPGALECSRAQLESSS